MTRRVFEQGRRANRAPFSFSPVTYEMGVVHAGMLHAGRVTGDARFTAFTERHLTFMHQWLPYFKKAEDTFKLDRANPFRGPSPPPPSMIRDRWPRP